MNKNTINKIEELAIKIAEILQEENPYIKVIIADNQIRITQDVITIQVKKETAQEVSVQEQSVAEPLIDSMFISTLSGAVSESIRTTSSTNCDILSK